MNKKCHGFTIIETVITLSVICFLTLLGTLYLSDFRSKIIFTNSVQQFKTSLDQACRQAAIRKENILIDYYPNSHLLEMKGNNYYRKISFATNLKIDQISNFRIADSGSISPRTIKFSDGKNKAKIKIQMTWGRMINEE